MLNTAGNNSEKLTAFITDAQRQMFSLINVVILCNVISMFGSVGNVINVVVFYRQGLDTTINISFFSLSISDLFSLVAQIFLSMYSNPLILDLKLPIIYPEIQHFTVGISRAMFSRTTCLITAFITVERCMCVVLPLHIKRVITPRITTTVIVVIFSSTFLSLVPLYFTSFCAWKFNQDSNSSLLGLAFTSANDITEPFVFCAHGVLTFVGFLSVLTFTFILICKLGQKNVWRKSANLDQEKTKTLTKRDSKTITMVVLIACTLVVCYSPTSSLGIATFLQPEFSISGIYHNLYFSLWYISYLFENINSSINIFLYLKMSSKYRQTFMEVFNVQAKN